MKDESMIVARSRQSGLLVVLLIGVSLFAACSRDPEKVRQEHVRAGDEYIAQKKYREAIVEFRVAIQAVPRSGPTHLKLADAYFTIGDGSNGLREYLKAADLMPDDVQAQLKAGRALLLAGQFDGAKERAKKLLAANARNVDAQILLGNALAALKDLDGAITEVENAIEQDPQRSLSYTNLGMLHLAKGERDQAEAAFRHAVEIDPQSVNAVLALANFHWSIGNKVEAENALKRAAAIDPKNFIAHRALATFFLSTNRPREAEPHLKQIAENSTVIGPKLVLADYYRAMGKNDEARTLLEAISKERDGFVAAETRIASMQFGADDKAAAHKTIDAVLARNVKDPQAQLVKAGFLATDRRFAEALEHATIAVTNAPQLPGAHMMAGSLYAMLGKLDEAIQSFQEVLRLHPGDPQAETGLARLYLARSDWATALLHAGAAVKAAPQSRDAHLQLARALTERGDFHNAESELKLLSEQASDDSQVHYALGRFYILTKDKARARVSFTAAAKSSPETAPLAALVALDLAEGKLADARARLEERLQTTPNSPPLLVLAARAYATAGDLAAAESALQKAIASDPSYLDAYQQLARLFIRQHRLDEARQEFENITARDQKSVGAHTMAAILLEQEGKHPEARKHYEEALAIDSRAAVPANNLAWLMTETEGDLDVALHLAQTAKAGLPEQPEISDTLGWIYYRKGLTTLAITSLKQSVAANPHNPLFQYHLGLAYAKNGEKDRARQLLQGALAISADFEGANDARTALESITG